MSTYYKDGEFFPIPDAYCYVLSTDMFMSRWGPAENMANVCVIPCPDDQTAHRVIQYVKSRSEQQYVRVVYNKPKTQPLVLYSLMTAWIETSKCAS
jgi:hypothetical protein